MPLGASRLSLLALAQVEAGPAERPWAVQAYGDAQVDTAYSQFGGASVYLDGTGDYIEVENDFLFGSVDDFTLEFWYKKHTTNATEQIASNRGAYNTGHWYIQFDHTTDKIQWGVNGAAAQRSTSTFDDTDWHHFALVRDSGTFELFVDGSSEGTLTGSYDWGREGEYYKFGQVATNHGNLSIDEIRISNIPRYTSGFTPNGIEFRNDDSTLLLVHCNGSDGSTIFTDDDVTPTPRSAVTLTANGNLQVDTAQNQFGGASALFDGSGDYLSFDANVLNDLPGNDYTMEMWARFSDTGTFRTLLANQGTNGAVFLQRDNANKISLFYIGDTATLSTTSTVTSGVWYHIALVVDGGTQKLFLDGTLEASRTETTYTSTTNLGMLGRRQTVTSRDMSGHIDEFRISNVARYTASFTVPTEPFVNDYATVVLAHMDGTDGSSVFSDDFGTGRSAVGVSAIGNAQISTAQSQIGGSSAVFDGSGDYLTTPVIELAGDYTVECWFRANNVSGGKGILGGNDTSPYNALNVSNTTVYWNNPFIQFTSGIVANTWYHIAVTRSGSTVRLFADGVEQGSGTNSDTIFASGPGANSEMRIGRDAFSAYFNGYIDELRISNTARYTSGFTPESTQFTNDANTLLLVHMDGANGDTDFTDDNS